MWATYISDFQKTAQNKHSLNVQKLAQSGHSDCHTPTYAFVISSFMASTFSRHLFLSVRICKFTKEVDFVQIFIEQKSTNDFGNI
jgi:hypothetical protein